MSWFETCCTPDLLPTRFPRHDEERPDPRRSEGEGRDRRTDSPKPRKRESSAKGLSHMKLPPVLLRAPESCLSGTRPPKNRMNVTPGIQNLLRRSPSTLPVQGPIVVNPIAASLLIVSLQTSTKSRPFPGKSTRSKR